MSPSQRMQLASKADFCVRWLKAQGLQVISIAGDDIQPRITVRYSELCDRFENVAHAYMNRKGKGKKYLAWVFRFDCMVQWEDIVNVSLREFKTERAYRDNMSPLRRFLHSLGNFTRGAI